MFDKTEEGTERVDNSENTIISELDVSNSSVHYQMVLHKLDGLEVKVYEGV